MKKIIVELKNKHKKFFHFYYLFIYLFIYFSDGIK